jgi:hypothetical protein
MTQAHRVALREALANERISLKHGEAVDQEAAALLSTIRAQPTVGGAIARLTSSLAVIENAYAEALQPE